jgi:ribosomal protein L28
MYGHKVSHAKNRTNRRFDLNLQKTTLRDGKKTKKVAICTRCLRSRMSSR